MQIVFATIFSSLVVLLHLLTNVAMMTTTTRSSVLIWFRRDLRIVDNLVLHRAIDWVASHAPTQGASSDKLSIAQIIPVVCLGDAGTRDETLAPSSLSRKFHLECIHDLGSSLQEKYDLPLIISSGHPEDVVPALAQQLGGKGVIISSEEVCSEEKNIALAVRSNLPADWTMEEVWNYSLYHPDDLPFDVRTKLPYPFTAMRNIIERRNPNPVPVRRPVGAPPRLPSTPSQAFLDWLSQQSFAYQWKPESSSGEGTTPSGAGHTFEESTQPIVCESGVALRFRGGERAALRQLAEFCADGLSTYKATRNGSLGIKYSSKLSPWLAYGCISPRTIREQIRQWEERNGGPTEHTYWVTFEFMWRDYMRFLGMMHGTQLFHERGPVQRLPTGVWWDRADGSNPDAVRRFDAWKSGMTGVPYIDAFMRELVATGFMSNRGRQNVASFLIHDLHVDWRAGAAFFQKHLIDHDVTANWGNWLHMAGLAGEGARVNKFNPVKQAYDYDPKAEHARAWIHELRDVPKTTDVHAPAGTPAIYPRPIVKLKSFDSRNRRNNPVSGKNPKVCVVLPLVYRMANHPTYKLTYHVITGALLFSAQYYDRVRRSFFDDDYASGRNTKDADIVIATSMVLQ